MCIGFCLPINNHSNRKCNKQGASVQVLRVSRILSDLTPALLPLLHCHSHPAWCQHCRSVAHSVLLCLCGWPCSCGGDSNPAKSHTQTQTHTHIIQAAREKKYGMEKTRPSGAGHKANRKRRLQKRSASDHSRDESMYGFSHESFTHQELLHYAGWGLNTRSQAWIAPAMPAADRVIQHCIPSIY